MNPAAWRDETLRGIGLTICGFAILVAPVTMILVAIAGTFGIADESYVIHNSVTALLYGALGALLLRSELRNRMTWFIIAVAFCQAMPALMNGISDNLAANQGVAHGDLDTSVWLPGVATVIPALGSLWVVPFLFVPVYGLAVVPDGRLLSWKWIPLGLWCAVGSVEMYVAEVTLWPMRSDADGVETTNNALEGFVDATFGYAMLLAIAALVIRYRRAERADRRRLRWVLVGGFFYIGAMTTYVVLDSVLSEEAADRLSSVPAAFLPILVLALGMAIWRDQLFDVDVFISRTLVYLSTLAVIAGIYVGVVFGVGALIGQTGEGATWLQVAATVVIAVAFHPARVRLERLANRIVFGRRATPYEVLSDFTQRVAATDERLLDDVARMITGGTVATGASVWALDDGVLEPVSVWPEGEASAPTAVLHGTDDELIVPRADETHLIHHGDRVVGALGLTLPAHEALPPGDRSLIDELTAGIGLALWNRRLSVDLRASVDDLRSSRRRLVAVQDEARHRLERDLHDGAQQRLVALKVRLSIARQMADKVEATETAAALGALCDEADEAIESLRHCARGVYPPLLEAEGLPAALEAQVGRSALPIELACDVPSRHGRDLEATVYFSILESLAAVEHSGATDRVRVTVAENDGRVTFEVAGPTGVEPPRHVEDRIDAVGGQVRFDDGVVLSGSLPTTAKPEAVGV